MDKVKLKFVISFVLLINTVIFVLFFEEYVYLLDDYLIPLLFVLFLIDSLMILIPSLNKELFSGKYLKKFFKEYPAYNINKIKTLKNREDLIAFIIFLVYFTGITIIGLSYLYLNWFTLKYLYIIFLAINLADYFCILIWCPFRVLFLKNKCCVTCRISNWDRLMKFSLLLFIPNFYTISIFLMALIVFVVWELTHTISPERFYTLSNESLRCANCEIQCSIKK